MDILYILWYLVYIFSVLVCCTKKNLATLLEKAKTAFGRVSNRVARFFLSQNTKTVQNIPNYYNITK
jgi:hypothetical protein